MGAAAPFELSQLLRAVDSSSQQAAWEDLIARHTRLLLAVSRSFNGGHDEAMERYTYILDKLREDDFRRLRTFDETSGARFSTWLTVTARHLCLDHLRALYGRQRESAQPNRTYPLRSIRRALADSIGPEVDVERIIDEQSPSLIVQTVVGERDEALRTALTRLESRERLLLALRYDDDLSAARIARIVGLPTPFHVYRQLNTILEKLRLSLESRGIEGVDG
jgi:RNA polymerase sigma factor (sigma-70 family)